MLGQQLSIHLSSMTDDALQDYSIIMIHVLYQRDNWPQASTWESKATWSKQLGHHTVLMASLTD